MAAVSHKPLIPLTYACPIQSRPSAPSTVTPCHISKPVLIYSLVAFWYAFRAATVLITGVILVKATSEYLPSLIQILPDLMPTYDGIIYTSVSHVCTLVLGGVFGSRLQQLSTSSPHHVTFINSLVLALYFMSAAFVLSAAILQTGLTLNNPAACNAAVYCCVVFYFMSKGIIQMFLIERAHAIRAHKMSRSRDRLYLALLVAVVLGFGTIMITAFVWPISEVSGVDRICRIGLPLSVTIPMLTYDIVVNFALTWVFIWLLQPLNRKRMPSSGGIMVHRRVSLTSISPSTGNTDIDADIGRPSSSRPLRQSQMDFSKDDSVKEPRNITNTIERNETMSTELADYHPADVVVSKNYKWVDRLIFKSMFGAILVLLPTIANLGLLTHVKGKEQVTWAVVILHWLTIGKSDEAPMPKSLGVV
ncbi:hypothetical protein B9Z65_6077 [Elsinoe australis]|uniref:Uncharacterized protein n=1 Tax=Elsinoe australis TaxID=40998 RepID=A0A2P8A7M8_9PEZI|nr:hypothetical protein B9Z65_6077 [Elsinoe australis]